ncbi:MAG: tyrosine--tRNA ligase [Oscillospiraceae bacterium]|nr:tyrosine--tRNA ligase [Oscillospiraceae bacterium]
MTIYEELQWRGLIESISDPALIEKLNAGGMTFYIGTDPTADSLHLGHYSSFLITRRLAEAGHHPIILVGGATGLIGDPRGTVERELSQKEIVFRNFEALKSQVQKLFPYPVVNNYDWMKDMTALDFFRDIGKYIGVGYMLSKDHVKRQMETGISYAEFSYMLIQGYDFKYLHEHKGVDLQVAGSDQWGNITTGIELIRKTTGDTVYALTMPLITDSQGNKFGKSEGNAVWLDRTKTSPYELYQFLLNAEDVMAVPYLKLLTFLTREEIEDIEQKHNAEPHLRLAQKALAKAIVTDLHGADAYEEAMRISEQLFSGDIRSIPPHDLLAGLKNVPHFTVTEGSRLLDILKAGGIASSNREANEFLNAGAISLNGEPVRDGNRTIGKEDAIDGTFLVLRRGKKKYYVATFA